MLLAAFTLMALVFATFWCAGASPALSFAGAALLGCGYAVYLPALIANVRLSCVGFPQRNVEALLLWGNLGSALGAFISGRLAETRVIAPGVDIALLICGLAAARLAPGSRR